MTGIRALAHVMIRVRDFERALPFYTDVLGLREAFRLQRDDGSTSIIYLHLTGRQFVELSLADQEAPQNPFVGYAHMCLEVENIHDLHDRLQKTGYVVPDSLKTGKDGSWQFWLRDPDGNRIELMQYTPESKQTPFVN